jgi:hypothetical protein
MTIELITSKEKTCFNNSAVCKDFLQKMMNRISVGHYRYGAEDAGKKYGKRLVGAVRRYALTGNQEYLIDAANYALLECAFPSHKDAHHKHLESNGRNFIPN